jgi:hypothetical protein
MYVIVMGGVGVMMCSIVSIDINGRAMVESSKKLVGSGDVPTFTHALLKEVDLEN